MFCKGQNLEWYIALSALVMSSDLDVSLETMTFWTKGETPNDWAKLTIN